MFALGNIKRKPSIDKISSFIVTNSFKSLNTSNDDMKAVNTEADPNCVAPVHSSASVVENGQFRTVFGKHSWNVVRLKK